MTPPHTDEDEPLNRRSQLNHLSHQTTAREPGRLESFARNRYFHGKLMTARDMQLDQDYHAGRLEAFLQHVVGEGVACGLSLDVIQNTEDDDLKVTVRTGSALDCFGRPVVLTGEAHETYTPGEVSGAPLADEDTETTAGISLFLRYDECAAEKVPLPNSEDACGEECTYNRIMEDYEIVLRRGAPSHPKPVRMVTFPTEDELNTYDPTTGADEHDPGLHKVATSYYESEEGIPRPCRDSGDPLIFLGHFTSDGDGDGDGVGWTRELDQKPRSYVFGNDMLYAAIVRHATNFENPHGVVASVEAVEPDDEGDIDLRSNSDTIAIEGLPGDNAISLDVAQEVLDRIVASVEGVGPDDDGDIDLNSPQETLVIDTDEDAHRIDIDVAENLRGRVRTVKTVEPDDGGNVDLASPDETVAFTTDPDDVGANTVGLSVTGLADLEERLSQLEQRHEEDIARLTERLIRLEHYVMERSVWRKCRTFGIVFERFDRQQTAARISRVSLEFLDRFEAGERIDPGEYFDYLAGVLELQRQLLEELEESSGPQRRVRNALDELEEAVDNRDEEDVLPAARAQNKAASLFRCVHPIEIG